MSIDGAWINEMWHTMEYCSLLKRKEIILHVTTWMTFEDFMPGEIRQSPKTTYCMIPSIIKMPEIVDRDEKIS